LFIFGGKTLITAVSRLLLNQTTSVLIVAYLGPSALALYARPRSIVYHINTLVHKMAMTLTPTVSSLQSTGNLEEIRTLLIKSVRYSVYLVLPMILSLVVFGGPIMRFWMGPRYANGLIPAIIAIGYLAALAQAPILMILVGMNAHGRAGVANVVASLCSAGLVFLALGPLEWGLAGAAVAVTLPLTILNLTYLPVLVCRRVQLDLRLYFSSVTAGPALHVFPFAVCLVIGRLVFDTEPLIGFVCGGSVGYAILVVLCWRYVIPTRIQTRLLRYVRVRRSVV
jgi:O-antigen/teichoic acid export membrane protein